MKEVSRMTSSTLLLQTMRVRVHMTPYIFLTALQFCPCAQQQSVVVTLPPEYYKDTGVHTHTQDVYITRHESNSFFIITAHRDAYGGRSVFLSSFIRALIVIVFFYHCFWLTFAENITALAHALFFSFRQYEIWTALAEMKQPPQLWLSYHIDSLAETFVMNLYLQITHY